MKTTFVANVATISEDLLTRAASDGGKPSTGMPQSGLGLARAPPMPCPPSTIQIILARDAPIATTVSALPEGWRNDA
ncbi:hypothetical protein THARTR1_04740 [Trichoderma harzianum]|uniref:Uncharacterized protein n=1 Tax=Trichoderma harzianum TaxID=5544 RepID=A0A2K0UB98_TRIHA|nr:hypothetical protein THARTR1_04740 [Trichoderma harzianum]